MGVWQAVLSLCASIINLCDRGSSTTTTGTSVPHPSRITIGGLALEVEKRIAEGGFAFVYRCSSLDPTSSGRRSYACKRFIVNDEEQEAAILKEIELHRCISSACPCVVQYVAHQKLTKSETTTGRVEIWFVMELCDGSLRDEVDKRLEARQVFSPEEICQVLSDLVTAVACMHAQHPPISHWDIKPENLLRVSSHKPLRYKLCDFGSASNVFYQCHNSRQVAVAECELDARLTTLYRAPESLDLWSKAPVGTACDMWEIGVLLYVLLTLTMPFEDNPRCVMNGKYKAIPLRSGTEQQPDDAQHNFLVNLVQSQLLVLDPGSRPSIFEVSRWLHDVYPQHAIAVGATELQPPRFS